MPSEISTADPGAWTPDLLASEVEFAISPTGRLRREDREVAFALEIERLRAEVNDLRASVIAFGGLWAVKYARDWCMPSGHLDPTHYDILKRAGARMDDFIRGGAENA